MPSVTFHIGLHKTGTTFLQRNVFPVMEGLHTYMHYNPLWELFNASKGRNTAVSCERLSGSPFSGSWANQGATYVKNIGRMFPEAKCIIGFRKHDALVRSLYKQYLHEGSAASPDELFHSDGSGKIGPEDLRFRRRVEQCDQHFADVFVYTQEELRDNLGGFLNDLSQFLGIPPLTANEINQTKRNVGVRTQEQVQLLRTLNRVNRGLKKSHLCPPSTTVCFAASTSRHVLCASIALQITEIPHSPYPKRRNHFSAPSMLMIGRM